jgi:hypothetical protein
MPTFKSPFAYNTGGPISGTTQYDDLVVGDIEVDYSSDYGGVKWWSSPEDITGYVIGNARPGGQPVPPGVTGTANVGFFRSKGRTDQAFLDLANYIGAKNGQPTFTTTNQAEVWLESNGYYTSFNLPTPTPTTTNTPTPSITASQTVTPTNTTTQTQTPTPSITASQTVTPTNTTTQTQTPTPSITASQTVTPTPSITASQTVTPTVTQTRTPTQTPTRTGTPTPTNINAQGFSYANFASTAGLTLVGAAAVSGGTIIALTTTSSASVGNMYRTTAIQYNRNFSTQWSSFIGGGTGADGYCVQWTTTNNTNGTAGGGVGRIESSSNINAIGFYTYINNNFQWYKSNVLQSTTSVSAGFWRQRLYFWADYNNSAQTLALYYSTTNSKPGSPNITYSSFSFDTGSYYMGFGAAIGGSNDNQEILSWSLQFT